MIGGIIIICAVVIALLITIFTHISNRKKVDDEGFDIYLIKKGKHYSLKLNSVFRLLFKLGWNKKTLRFSAIFGDGCNYDNIAMGADGYDINKLYGTSYGFDDQFRSVRIGWRYNSNLKVIELSTYCHLEGKRYIKPLMNISQYEIINFTIFHDGIDSLIVQAKDEEGVKVTEKILFNKKNLLFRWRLFPYFGGNKKAPNDMKILIKKM